MSDDRATDLREEPASLRPCPFCGRSPFLRDEESQGDAFYVTCLQQGCPGNGVFHVKTAAEAVEAWNRRPSAWISVADRVPEDGAAVIGANHQSRGLVVYSGGCWWLEKYVRADWVTHWQHWSPLPPGPEVTHDA